MMTTSPTATSLDMMAVPLEQVSRWTVKNGDVQFAQRVSNMVKDLVSEQAYPGICDYLSGMVKQCDAGITEQQRPAEAAQPATAESYTEPEADTLAAENIDCVCVVTTSCQEGRPGRGRPSISLFTSTTQQAQTDALLSDWLSANYIHETQQVRVGTKLVPAHIGLAAFYYLLMDAHLVSGRENVSAFHACITHLLGYEPCSRRYLSAAFSKVKLCGVGSLADLTLQQVQRCYAKYATPNGHRGTWQGIMPHEFTTYWEGLYEALRDSIP